MINFLKRRIDRNDRKDRSLPLVAKRKKKKIVFVVEKRQKFVIMVILLSLTLFIVEFTGYRFTNSGIVIDVILSLLTDLLLFWAIREDLKQSFSWSVFILPFLFSLAFSMFYFLTPARFLSRILLTSLYAFGLYSLLLSQNIFIVASTRTIALLSGARIVSFVLTLVSYFFLTNIAFSLHIFLIPSILIVFLYTFLLLQHSLWTYTLQKTIYPLSLWVLCLTLCLVEIAAVLWFWPSSPTVVALFLTGFFYTIAGMSHVWLEKRLFRGVLWEYVWVGTIVFFVLVL